MAGVLDGVNRRTQLAGNNRLELLMFRLKRSQRYGINVFKVREVIQCPPLTHVPHSHPAVCGVTNIRGQAISIIDLGMALGMPAITDPKQAFVIVTEYNRTTQGFLVNSIDHIVNLNWEEVLPPPKGAGASYMTAVTHVDKEIVEIIDVEKIMSEVIGGNEIVSEAVIAQSGDSGIPRHILVVDDSSVARNQIKRALEQLGIGSTLANDGAEGLKQLQNWAAESQPITERIAMVISDVEMPRMDGYTMTAAIRQDPNLRDLYIVLHTSLSGLFNNALVDKVGANKFIPKFNPDELATAVLERIRELEAAAA
ncbi:MAG: chemotaxis protein [Chromatiales bacterium]|nr:chemotaxis protein CheV [Gammaproteobacteria bacterium]MBW6476642.1 chemotaxis protein [Chromatiales bacterium]